MSHGKHCRLRFYERECPVCQAEVFYYECKHGSIVWFDSAFPAWEKHGCQHPPKLEKQKVLITAEYFEGIRIEQAIRRYAKENPIRKKIDAPENSIHGIIREIVQGIDKKKGFRIGPSTIGAAFLKNIPDQLVQVTIHEKDIFEGCQWSYTFLAGKDLASKISIKDWVDVNLELVGQPTKLYAKKLRKI